MSRRLLWLCTTCLLVGAIADRMLKILAIRGTTFAWLFARFTLFKNEALVFSWPLSNTIGMVLMVMAMVVVGWLAWRAWRNKRVGAVFGAVMLLIGAFSNLFDRVHYGYVIDWAYLGRWWPVFNLADVMITIGVVLIAMHSHQKNIRPGTSSL